MSGRRRDWRPWSCTPAPVDTALYDGHGSQTWRVMQDMFTLDQSKQRLPTPRAAFVAATAQKIPCRPGEDSFVPLTGQTEKRSRSPGMVLPCLPIHMHRVW